MKLMLVATLTANTISASVEATYNDKKLTKPMIVISPVNVSESSFYFNSKEGDKEIPVVITVYSNTSAGMDLVGDVVIGALKNDTIAGLAFTGHDSDYDFNYDTKNPLHAKTITATYNRI